MDNTAFPRFVTVDGGRLKAGCNCWRLRRIPLTRLFRNRLATRTVEFALPISEKRGFQRAINASQTECERG